MLPVGYRPLFSLFYRALVKPWEAELSLGKSRDERHVVLGFPLGARRPKVANLRTALLVPVCGASRR